MPAKVLIVDDETDLVRLVRYNLEKEGFQTCTAFDGKATLSELQREAPDLMILDLMLPDMSGIEICRRVKSEARTRHIPVIMLTARSAETDRISGFEAGADDYVVKPFSPKELVLRVKAMLGRTMAQAGAPTAKETSIRLGGLVIRPEAYSVETETGEPIVLSLSEFNLLLALARHPNTVKTREQLIAELWEQDGEDINDRTVDTLVKRLRQKLGGARNLVETIRGVGYRINAASVSKSLLAV